ncbi:MAG TPA: glycosyltransferase family 9 protein, partial [Acetobacteraceae bacterium]
MRILFITSNRIGDAVLSTGLLDHLIRTYPRARFTIACGPAAEGVFIRMPRLERLIVMEKQRFGLHWLPLWGAAVRHWWDLVVDIRASAIGWLVPARRRVSMRRRPGHKTEQLAAILGLDPAPLPVAWTAQADRDRAAQLLPDGAPIIALAPTANWTGKIWPAERFVALFHALQAGALPNARVAVLGGPGEQELALAAPVLAALPGAINLCGLVSLPEAAACLARCALYIGNDSGLTHLAAATGTPTLSLFGPTPADEYAPAGRCVAVAVAHGPDMEDLPVAEALAA